MKLISSFTFSNRHIDEVGRFSFVDNISLRAEVDSSDEIIFEGHSLDIVKQARVLSAIHEQLLKIEGSINERLKNGEFD